MTIEPGSTLGPYEILSPIGAGGMGEVFKARDTRLDRDVAIKVLPDSFASDEQFLQRFEREAKTISSLNHPNICVLHDIGEQDGHRYLVMEYIDGESLSDRLAKGPLPIDQVLRYGAQIADALDRAHRQGIVHRDLKPGNIMITKSGAKLLDFGLAKTDAVLFGARRAPGQTSGGTTHDQPTEHKPLTQEGTILGTFQYMAPEQLEGIEADVRTDIFALGAVLYEISTARKAFSGKSKASLIASILDHQPPSISSVQPMTPPAFDHVVRRCLEKDPEDRWQSTHDIASELRWISEAGSQAGVAAPVTLRRKTRERLAWGIAAALLVALIAVSAILVLSREEAAPVMTTILPPAGSQFSFSGIQVTSAAVSPDGRRIAFCAPDEGGRTSLWIRDLARPEPRRLSGTENANNPFWSPDNKFVAFFARGKLKKVDINGSPPLSIADAGGGRRGSWNDDGVILFSPTAYSPIHRVAETGGKSVPVTELDTSRGETTHRWAYFLPDGNHFIFAAGTHGLGAGSEANAVYVGSLDSTERKLILHARSNVEYANGYLVYILDRILVAQPFDPDALEIAGDTVPIVENVAYASDWFGGLFSVSPDGVLVFATGNTGESQQLTWLDREGNTLGVVGTWTTFGGRPELSPDDRRAAIEIVDANGLRDIWIFDLERDLSTRFTFDPSDEADPVWSPDGATIVYAEAELSSGVGSTILKTKSAIGSGEAQVLWQARGFAYATDWPTDGELLVSATNDDNSNDILVLDREGTQTPRDLIATQFDEPGGQLSPDAKWIVYASNESGEYHLYVTSFPEPGGKWQVSRQELRPGGVSWRGNSIFYLVGEGTLMATHVEVRGDSLVLSNPVSLFVNPLIEGFDVTRDGQKFLMTLSKERGESPPLTIVTNWTALLDVR